MNRKTRKQWEDFLPSPGIRVTLILNKGLSVESKRELFYHSFTGDYKPEMIRFTETRGQSDSEVSEYSVLLKYADISEWIY